MTASPSVTNSSQGSNVTFTCTAMGGPGNMFSWTRLYDNIPVGNMSSLTVSVEGADDGGMYRCLVTNPAGNDSDTVTLNGEDCMRVSHLCSSVTVLMQLVLSSTCLPCQ